MRVILPVVTIGGDGELLSLAEAWEKSVIACWEKGIQIPTQYDQEGDPNSRDINVRMVIDPNTEPLFHRALPGGFYDNEIYVAEVREGVHNHWIDPEAGKWQYTYHERMESYQVPGLDCPVNQLDYVVAGLVEAPHTRRVQIGIWKPWEDAGIDDPACLQRMWFRIYNYDGNTGDLVMACYMRSNDAFKAAWMNMYAFMEIGYQVARRVSELLRADIRFSQYVHSADSYHIYGSYFEEFKQFLELNQSRDFEDRTWTREQAKLLIKDARERVLERLNNELDKLEGEVAKELAARIVMLERRYAGLPYIPLKEVMEDE